MIKKIIILLGPPGSGKGTQGAILSRELSLPHISTGDIFRKMILKDSEESKVLADYMNEGKLIPTDMVNQVVKKFILSKECKDGCILDGYPRTLGQAEYFSENIDADINVIFFDIDNEIIIKRILGRISCKSCGRIYNAYFNKPARESVCDRLVMGMGIPMGPTVGMGMGWDGNEFENHGNSHPIWEFSSLAT